MTDLNKLARETADRLCYTRDEKEIIGIILSALQAAVKEKDEALEQIRMAGFGSEKMLVSQMRRMLVLIQKNAVEALRE